MVPTASIIHAYNGMVLPTVQMSSFGLPFDGETVKLFRQYVRREREKVQRELEALIEEEMLKGL